MKLADYIRSLTPEQRQKYAHRCGTTISYMNVHILPGNKEPRKRLRDSLAKESGGKVSLAEVLEHFGVTVAA